MTATPMKDTLDKHENAINRTCAELDRVRSDKARLIEALRDLIGPAKGGYDDGYPDEGEVTNAQQLLRELEGK